MYVSVIMCLWCDYLCIWSVYVYGIVCDYGVCVYLCLWLYSVFVVVFIYGVCIWYMCVLVVVCIMICEVCVCD